MSNDKVNGAEAPQEKKLSPSEKAYADACMALTIQCARLIEAELPGITAANDGMANMLCYVVSAARQREIEIRALVELLDKQKIVTTDEWLNKAAVLGNKYADMMSPQLDAAEEEAKRPKLAIATGHVPRNRKA